MHRWGCALKRDACAKKTELPTKPKENSILDSKDREEGTVKQTGPAASWSCELLTPGL